MANRIDKWSVQIRRGYLELCILTVVDRMQRVYGFQLISVLKQHGIEMKEGTLYPLLSRMVSDQMLAAVWETENLKGHPRKFYSLTGAGQEQLRAMQTEYTHMQSIFQKLMKVPADFDAEKEKTHAVD